MRDSDDVGHSTETNMGSLTEEEFRAGNKNKVLGSIVLFFSPVLAMAILMLPVVQSSQSDTIAILLLGGSIVPAMLGVVLLYYYGIAPRMVLRGLEILKEASQSTPILTKSFALTKIDDVYVFCLRSGMIYFVAFRGDPTETKICKMDIPKNFLRWSDKIEVDGINLFHREDVFTIPLLSGKYGTGEAVLFSALHVPTEVYLHAPDFSKDKVHSIVKKISEFVKRDYTPQ